MRSGWFVLLGLWFLAAPAAVEAQFNYETNSRGVGIIITGYTGPGGVVIIPSQINGLTVATIGYEAFSDRTNVTSVTIPNGVTNIASFAFEDCAGLTNIDFPDGILSFGTNAFYYCTRLTNVTIPISATNIGSAPFLGCSSLESISVDTGNSAYSSAAGVLFNKNQTRLLEFPAGLSGSYTIPSSVTIVASSAFSRCTNLISVTIPNSVTNVEAGAFEGSGPRGVTIENGVTEIWGAAFSEAASLATITIPDSVISIGSGAFLNCTSLTNATIPDSVTSIGEGAFYSCSSLTGIKIPNSATNIGNYAFDWCSSLTSANVPANDTILETGVFGGCSSVANVTIENGVAAIEPYAFLGCSMTNITIPESVTNVGVGAFNWCRNLTAINVAPGNTAYSSVAGVLFDRNQTTLIAYPSGLGGNYIIPDTVTNIGENAFEGSTNVASIIIPASVTSIGEYGLSGCFNLTAAYFLGNAPSADYTVFNGDPVTAYYLPATTGWTGYVSAGIVPIALWTRSHPLVLSESLGVRSNQFEFTMVWVPNHAVVVEACTSLSNPNWTPIATNTLNGGTSYSYFIDAQWTNFAARFYRVRAQ
jgi:hypothetical protein